MNSSFPRNILLGIATAVSAGSLTSQRLAAQTSASPNAAQQLISVLTPQVNNTYSDGPIPAQIQLDASADVTSFRAYMNGTEVTSLFSYDSCGSGGCVESASIPGTYLAAGTNLLIADVNGPNESAGSARVKFQYAPAGSSSSVTRLIPSVAVQTVALPGGADPTNINSYQIVVGPGPGFQTRTYTVSNLSCPSGMNSMQVLVLKRKTLDPENAVGGSNPGQSCLGNASTLNNFLQNLPQGDLVIANSFLGTMSNLNTTAIGGTNYSGTQITPNYYNVIGVAGAPAGTAYESYQPTPMGAASLAPLTGSLMLDIRQNYFFVPSSFRELDVTPNDPAVPGDRTSTIVYAGQTYQETLPDGVNGGFWVFQIDRRLGSVSETLYSTNGPDAAAALQDLTTALQSATENELIVLTTVGTPFSSSTVPGHNFWVAINDLGGNGFLSQKLVSSGTTYTLIGNRAKEYQKAGHIVENSSLWSDQKETGSVSALLARDRKNRLYAGAGLSDWAGAGQPPKLNWQWQEVSYQQPQDWPALTTGQQNAYLDLTAYNSYPAVGVHLGCNLTQTQPCQPIRSYYDGGVGGNGTLPRVLSLPYHQLTYQPNPNYTAEDFEAVIGQLEVEQAYISNVYQTYSQFRALNSEESDNISLQLSEVASNIDGSVKTGNPTILIDKLTQASAVTAILSIIPGVGPAFGAISTLVGGAAVFLPASSGVPDGSYGVTLNELINRTATLGTSLQDTTDTLFTSIVNDWGKVSVIGGGYGAQQAPWYMCTTCENSNVPRAAIPAIALGARRDFYHQLFPLVYSLDVFHDQTAQTPKQIGGWVSIPQPPARPRQVCYSAYENVPAGAWWSYSNMTAKSLRDFYVITQTRKEDPPIYNPGTWPDIIFFPSDSLLGNVFDAPTVNSDGSVGGGSGFIRDQFLPDGRLLPDRTGEIANRLPCTP